MKQEQCQARQAEVLFRSQRDRDKPNNMHIGHRERMRERVKDMGFEQLSDHELLEYLLYGVYTRVNINPIAHELLQKFGSLKGVLDASTESLCTVKGVSLAAATQLKGVVELLKRYERDALGQLPSYRTVEDIAAYLHSYFTGLTGERLYLVTFNNRMSMIGCELISEGIVNSTDISMRRILTSILNKSASCAVLAHNHPSGNTVPSTEDIEFSEVLEEQLRALNVVLLEHLIFSDNFYRAVLKDRLGTYRPSPLKQRMDAAFYQHFYGGLDGEGKIQPLFEHCNQ